MTTYRPTHARGFTLVEMLITVTVIGIVVAMSLGALVAAQDSAREQRTRSLISKLHTQLMYRWESYQSRRIPMLPRMPNEKPQDFAARRLLAQRELMRLELPQRWLDVVENTTDFPANPAFMANLTELPALSESYSRRYNNNKIGNVFSKPSDSFEAAECLYMIVTMGHDDSLGTTKFRATDVGDVDQDGMPEFIDGWGKPISFVRWAPGYLPASALPANAKHAAITDLQTGDPDKDHDPFDPLRLDFTASGGSPRGFRLMPLIFSPGPDGESDIWAKNAITGALLNDPYDTPAVGSGLPAGTPMTAENTVGLSSLGEGRHVDNLTNHALEVR